jgi:CheY-like chemotaxis protein
MTERAILCVDDERMVLMSLRDQIRKHFAEDYICELAESAEEALEVIEELHSEGVNILVVLSDWQMPGMRGDEFLVRVHAAFPQIVTVMLSGQAEPMAVQRAKDNAHLYAFVAKPWSEEHLASIIRSGLEMVNE